MAKGFKHGAGGSNVLNFKVVGNPQPTSPKENTIWVDTDVDITAYYFSSEPIFTNLDESNLTNANDVISGRGDNGENFYGSLPIMWSKTYLLKTKLIAGVTYKLDSTGLGYGRIGAFSKQTTDDNYAIRIEGADPLSLLHKDRHYSIFTPIETTDAYFYYCTDVYNTGSNPAFSVWFALYLVGNPIWITTDVTSTAAFNALKKNSIQVYPLSAKQYVNGVWVEKTAKTYQGGEWVSWWDGELFKNGNEYVGVTGGWEAVAISNIGGTAKEPTLSITDVLSMSVSGRGTVRPRNNYFDLTPYSKLTVKTTAASGEASVVLANINDAGYNDNKITTLGLSGSDTKSLDISAIDKKVYLLISLFSASAAITEIYFER